MQLIGLSGKARSGKNTVADYLSERYEFRQYAMAGPLKAMLGVGLDLPAELYQTTEEKEAIIPWLGKSYRHCAQTIGTDWMRKLINEDGWLLVARRHIGSMEVAGAVGVVITDLRFENELAMVREMGGTVIHIKRSALPDLPEATKAHESEKGVAIGPADLVIVNDGSFQDLYRQIDFAYASLLGVK